MKRCDFCFAPAPTWRYPAASFETEILEGALSLEDWGACDECAVFINDTNLRGLAQRSLTSLIAQYPELEGHAAAVYGELATLHQQFYQHRKGAPSPIKENASV